MSEKRFFKGDEANLLETFSRRLEELQGKLILTTLAKFQEDIGPVIAGPGIAAAGPDFPEQLVDSLRKAAGEDLQWIEAGMTGDSGRSGLKARLAQRRWSLAGVDALLADTGSAVVLEQRRPSQLLYLLPPRLVLVAGANQLYPDLGAYLAAAQPSAGFVCISGPSRTADIEKKLVLGAHGPRELYLILITDWNI